MRLLVRLVLVFSLATAAIGQSRVHEPERRIRIRSLTVASESLPPADRDLLTRLFEGRTYPEGEVGERIRQALRNTGYVRAVVDEPRFSFAGKASEGADVSAKVHPGIQYRLGELKFLGATVFTPDELRSSFLQRRGDLFDARKFGASLEGLRQRYGSRGYVDMVATPAVLLDDSQRTIGFNVQLDEGQTYDFGKLLLEGVEPHPGAGKELVHSWDSLEGRRYDPEELKHWLRANHFAWKVSALASDSIRTSRDSGSRLVDVTLTQWPR